MKLVVTSGGTREPIDGVRYITNFSTGRTGAALADFLNQAGHDVWYVHGKGAAQPSSPEISKVEFETFQDLDKTLKETLKAVGPDAVVHAAAVSDYSIDKIYSDGDEIAPGMTNKLDSAEDLEIVLKRNFKIVDRLKKYSSNERTKVVAFKLTNRANEDEQIAAALKLSLRPVVDFVVQNDLTEIKDHHHKFQIFRMKDRISTCTTKQELAQTLDQLLREEK